MKKDLLSLDKLYSFVRKHRNLATEAMQIDGSSRLGSEYSDLCRHLTSSVPKQQGLYLWGFYNKNGFWTNIYIGKAGLRRTASLNNRIFKELTAERACIWREVLTQDELHSIGARIHPKMWTKNVHHWNRACEKAGTTHIAWLALPDTQSENIALIENDLIESMNPVGNRRRVQPPDHLREDTKEVFGEFREMINEKANRASRFPLKFHEEYWKKVN